MKYQYVLKQVQKEDQFGSVVIQSLQEVNLEIEAASFNYICGPEGSGKSRVLNILALLDMPTKGEFYFKNSLVNQFSVKEISAIRATRISYVPQVVNLNLTSTVLENVSMVARILGNDNKEAKDKAMYWLHKTDLSKKSMCTPLELSLIDLKRICIAKAMMKNPEILLLDDIFYKLNSNESEELLGLISKINQEKKITVVQTVRNDSNIKHGSFVYDITNGKTFKRCLASTAA